MSFRASWFRILQSRARALRYLPVVVMLGLCCVVLSSTLKAQAGYQVALPEKGQAFYLQMLEQEHFLGLPGLDSIAKREISAEEVWSMICGVTKWDFTVRTKILSLLPWRKPKRDTVLTSIWKPSLLRPELKEVYGSYPFWMGAAWRFTNLGSMHRILFFDYPLDPETGKNRNPLPTWEVSGLQKAAHLAHTKVDLAVTLYGDSAIRRFMENEPAQSTLIDKIAQRLVLKGHEGDGVHLEFLGFPADTAILKRFQRFVVRLSVKVKGIDPKHRLSIAVPNQGAPFRLDFKALAPYVDRYMMAGYDYRRKDEPMGPGGLVASNGKWGPNDIQRDLDSLLARGVPAQKIILSAPWYGAEWSAKTGSIGAVSLNDSIRILPLGYFRQLDSTGIRYDTESHTNYCITKGPGSELKGDTGRWIHRWWDSPRSILRKAGQLSNYDLAGACWWAIGYDRFVAVDLKVLEDLQSSGLPLRPVQKDTVRKDTHRKPLPPYVLDKDSIKKVTDFLRPGWPLSYVQWNAPSPLKQLKDQHFYWVSIDSVHPLAGRNKGPFIVMSPDIPLPADPSKAVLTTWSLAIMACFLWLGMVIPLFQYPVRKMLFHDQKKLGYAYPQILVGIFFLSAYRFGLVLDWWVYGLGMLLMLLLSSILIGHWREVKAPDAAVRHPRP